MHGSVRPLGMSRQKSAMDRRLMAVTGRQLCSEQRGACPAMMCCVLCATSRSVLGVLRCAAHGTWHASKPPVREHTTHPTHCTTHSTCCCECCMGNPTSRAAVSTAHSTPHTAFNHNHNTRHHTTHTTGHTPHATQHMLYSRPQSSRNTTRKPSNHYPSNWQPCSPTPSYS